jgi:CheY-like chemotaxis protein
MKILIVDDEEVARTSLTGLLAPMGEVTAVASGEEALARLEGGLRPDICCSDVLMPAGIDGLELMRRARAHPVWKDLPFVMISIAGDRAIVDAAVAGGAAGYILKPFLAVQTRCTVERLVRDHRAASSEHFLVTSRRLGMTLPALEARLAGFAADVDTVTAEVAGGRAGVGDLRRLHAATVVFGMWKAAALLREAIEDDTAPAARVLALEEVRHLVEDQVHALDALAPPEAA